jgi:hypothetical protein
MYANPNNNSANKPIILGETTFRHRAQRFGMLQPDRLRHLWILGKTGSGKSTLLANMLVQDLAARQGCALLDPHGDLVRTVLPHVPATRTNNVLLVSPEDSGYPVSFNIFRQGRALHPDSGLLSSQLVSVFRKQWSDSWGPRLEHVLRNAILAVAPDPRATLLFLYRFLTEEAVREKVVQRLKDPVVAQFWTREFPSYGRTLQGEALSPVLNKLGAFVSQPLVRNIVAQERSRVDLAKLMDDQGILLANLSSGRIGEDASRLLGALLLSGIQLAAMRRAGGCPPFIVYVDEFQNFVTESLSTMLAEARKFGLGLVLAHQYLGQLPHGLREAVLGNVGSCVMFRLGAGDAHALEGEFSPTITAEDLQSLGRYEIVARLLVNGQTLRPFSARTLSPQPAPSGGAERVDAIRGQSRIRYCRPVQSVEQAILAVLGTPPRSE